MPCRDLLAEEEAHREVVAKVHTLTRLLCLACQELDAAGQLQLADEDLREWWKKHLLEDAQRRREEEAQRKRDIAAARKNVAEAKRKLKKLGGK